jgi:Fe2+ transport system protein B
MAISLETQEIIFAFEAGNKDNFESWGKYELDELQDAYAEFSKIPEEERDSGAEKRIEERIKELESGEDQVQELRHEEEEKEKIAEQQREATTQNVISEPRPEAQPKPQHIESEEPKQKTPIIIGGIIIGVVILMLVVYFLK